VRKGVELQEQILLEETVVIHTLLGFEVILTDNSYLY
jgi:hypothetical protein